MPVDCAALELKSSFADPDAGAMPPLDASGIACATASDKDKCQNLVGVGQLGVYLSSDGERVPGRRCCHPAVPSD